MGSKIFRVSPGASELFRTAVDLASSDIDPEEARDVLIARAKGNSRLLTDALKLIPDHPLTYDLDGARRLLSAANSRAPVEPVAPQLAALYEDERYLDRLPLAEAINALEKLEPALHQLLITAAEKSRTGDISFRAFRVLLRQARDLVGPSASGSDPLLRSPLALQIVMKSLAESTPLHQAGPTDSSSI